MEGLLVGLFGTDSSSKSALLASLGKKSEAEGTVIYHRTDSGKKVSLIDDPQFPQRVQGYASIASICDHALFLYPKSGRLGPADGELAVLLESFSLPGTVELLDGTASPEAAASALRGTLVGGYPVEERSLSSTALDLGKLKVRGGWPEVTLVYVDRVFTVKGVGTVALGFVLSGKVSVHDKLRPIPGRGGLVADVKGIQINDVDSETAGRGIRVGLSLRGVDPEDLEKSHWLDDGSLRVTDTLSLTFAKSQFYKQPVDGREMHLQVPGEMLPATVKQDSNSNLLVAKLQGGVPAWDGMGTCLVDLNAKNLRIAGGCSCKF